MLHDDMDDARRTWWSLVVWLLIVIGGCLLAELLVGCTHAQPTPEEVIPCIPLVVQAPLIEIPERPPLTSVGWTREQVQAAPMDFARAVATDLVAWIGWGLELEAKAEASNAARPQE